LVFKRDLSYVVHFSTQERDTPSVGWYAFSVIGHISPKWTGWTIPEFGDRGNYLIDVNARVRLLSGQKAVLFGVGLD